MLFPLVSSAQVKRLSREAIDSIRNMKNIETSDSVLVFTAKVIDFGTMYESDSAKIFSFPFVNSSDEKVVIKNIGANCGCMHSFCEKYEYEPGEKGVLHVKFNPKERSGTVDKNIFVYILSYKEFCSSKDSSEIVAPRLVARLTLLGNVIDKNEWRHLPVSMGDLRLKRKSVVFEPVKPGTSPQMRIMCANVGKSSLRLHSRLLPHFVTFATEPSEIAPGEEGDIVITIDGDKLPECVNDKYRILVDGVEGGLSDRMIEIEFENKKE